MSADCKLCLAVLCGLPASGKTSLTRLLATPTAGQPDSKPAAQQHDNQDIARYIIVGYDTLLPADVEKALIEEETGESNNHGQSPWKQYRCDVYECVSALIECLQAGGSDVTLPAGVGAEVGRRFESAVLPQLQGLTGAMARLCVVIDDNMYYRSMRYRYYQLARKYTLGFCQIYLERDVNDAISQNSERACPVSREVMLSMAAKFEAPDPHTNAWENFSLVATFQDISLRAVEVMVGRSLDSPVLPVATPDEEEQTQARQICSASLIHQADQILRKIVSQEMVAAKGRQLSRAELRDVAQQLQVRRRLVLEQLRSGQLPGPAPSLSDSASSLPWPASAPSLPRPAPSLPGPAPSLPDAAPSLPDSAPSLPNSGPAESDPNLTTGPLGDYVRSLFHGQQHPT